MPGILLQRGNKIINYSLSENTYQSTNMKAKPVLLLAPQPLCEQALISVVTLKVSLLYWRSEWSSLILTNHNELSEGEERELESSQGISMCINLERRVAGTTKTQQTTPLPPTSPN